MLVPPKVSRRNALIHLQTIVEHCLIYFGSSNGTFVNKRRIQHTIRISDGDQITIGDQVLTFRQQLTISREPKTDLLQRTLRFFFQAEDGIRVHCVTGVQTCALPISWASGTSTCTTTPW